LTSKDSAERALPGGEGVSPSIALVAILTLRGIVAMLFGVGLLSHGLTSNRGYEYRSLDVLAGVALIPSACLLFLTSAYLWVHREK